MFDVDVSTSDLSGTEEKKSDSMFATIFDVYQVWTELIVSYAFLTIKNKVNQMAAGKQWGNQSKKRKWKTMNR